MPMIITHGRILRSAGDAGGTVSTEAPATVEKETEVDFKAEADALRVKLKETEERLKASEEKAKAEERAKMSDAEKRKADAEELERIRQETLKEYRLANLQKAGLDEEYLPLIAGETKDEIAASGELIRKLVEVVRTGTEAEVKKALARTGAPGQGDEVTEMDPVDFYAGLVKERSNG